MGFLQEFRDYWNDEVRGRFNGSPDNDADELALARMTKLQVTIPEYFWLRLIGEEDNSFGWENIIQISEPGTLIQLDVCIAEKQLSFTGGILSCDQYDSYIGFCNGQTEGLEYKQIVAAVLSKRAYAKFTSNDENISHEALKYLINGSATWGEVSSEDVPEILAGNKLAQTYISEYLSLLGLVFARAICAYGTRGFLEDIRSKDELQALLQECWKTFVEYRQ